MTSYLVIDGAQGEGGGQVLRTSLSLSILMQQPIELINIRANRNKPGLLRQHLTSLLAAQQICSAQVKGAELGSDRVRFKPGPVQAGEYHFAIGTAGSTVLVCQTILPVLATADQPSRITFEGGTHNGMSPSLCFLQQSYLPVLEQMGVQCCIHTSRLGFYPAGGGKWQLEIQPAVRMRPVQLTVPDNAALLSSGRCAIKGLVSQLPEKIVHREVKAAATVLGWQEVQPHVSSVDTPGPGNSFQLSVNSDSHCSLFELVGEKGVKAENVAKRCAGRVKQFLESGASVEEHLADQLLLPYALAEAGRYTTTRPSLHTLTNIEVINRFLPRRLAIEQCSDQVWEVKVNEQQ